MPQKVLYPSTSAPSTSVLHPSTSAPGTSVLHPSTTTPGTSVLHPSTSATGTSVLHPSTSAPGTSRRECQKCPVLRARLSKALQLKRDAVVKQRSTKMLLRQELRTNTSRTIKLLRQKVKRKDRQMKVLREQRGPTSVAAPAELERTRRELKNVKKRCTRLQSLVHQKMLLVKKDDTDTGLRDKLREQHAEIQYLEHHTLLLEESVTEQMEPQQVLDKPGQTVPVGMRLAVFDGLINQVPIQNIPHLIGKFAGRFGVSIARIPHKSSVEAMARELGVIADVQTAEALLNNKHVTLGFDATTQEGVHINAIHITTESACYVVAVDELPGGTAVDYSEHMPINRSPRNHLLQLHTHRPSNEPQQHHQ